MTHTVWWHLQTRLKIRWWVFNFISRSRVFSFRVTVHLLFSFLLQKTLISVFLARSGSLKLNHDTKYLMESEDTVEDPLMSVQFFINSKNFFISCDTSSTLLIFIAKTLKFVFLPRYESLKLNHDTNYLKTSEDTVEDPLMTVHFYVNSKSFLQEFFHFVLQSILCFHF